MIAAPDDVAELLFAGGSIEKSKFLGPNLVENDATRSGFDGVRFSVSVDCLLTEIRVLKPDAVVCMNASFRHRKFYFGCIGEKREPLLSILASTAWVLGQVVTTKRNVLRRRSNGFAAGRRKNVIRREHQHARFHLRLHRERHMHRHLVAVEVRVIGSAN